MEFYKENSLFILIIFAFIAIGFLLYFLRRPEYKKFKSMKYNDVFWRWKWKKENVIFLAPYCPKCQSELWYDDEHSKTTTNLNEKTTFLVCEPCGGEQKGRVKGGDRNYVINLVKREIYRRVSNKEFNKGANE